MQKFAQESFGCGVCFNLMQDPVCCGNDSCNYMLCREHVTEGMRCPNRCGADPIKLVKVQRVILNQLMSLTITCQLCSKNYELGDKEVHYLKHCTGIVFDNCVFPDCK